MNQYFSASGYTMTDTLVCVVNGSDIYQTNYAGNRRLIGKTQAAYEELEGTTKQYYDKLVELGVITPQKTPEQMMSEMQNAMLDMSKIITDLTQQVKELKNNESTGDFERGGQNVPGGESQRRSSKSAERDKRDSGQS